MSHPYVNPPISLLRCTTLYVVALLTSITTCFANDSADTLFGVDTSTDELVAIDATTGSGTAVGPIGFDSVVSLAFDPSTRSLYGVDFFSDQLIRIDSQTGFGTAVG
ncbi:MAG: hypothetical protein ACR2NM_14135, partial [Bythopirellula sp.]